MFGFFLFVVMRIQSVQSEVSLKYYTGQTHNIVDRLYRHNFDLVHHKIECQSLIYQFELSAQRLYS
jgi:putative endonuclease